LLRSEEQLLGAGRIAVLASSTPLMSAPIEAENSMRAGPVI
jgi:hypothetical protein